ncbi:MAG: type I restriction endonuclease subunit R [Chitinophagaceae bacterium]
MSAVVKEPDIEYGFVGQLTDLKYVYRPDIRDRKALEQNFRNKFESLNRVKLSDAEFARLRDEIITPDVFQASKTLRQLNTFVREDGTPLHFSLVNLNDWCKNEYEVINQLRMNTENSSHRYDVILLINGVPVVQIELKTLQISPRRAMQQIVDYKNDAGNGYGNSLLCFMQLFIVSNRSSTYYFSNNRQQHFNFNAEEQFLPVYKWATESNKKVENLYDFTEKFLAKCNLGEMISRYMVLVESEQKILVMRPYQIYAVKAIVECINQNRGNGYIWHTTGSGKTLTSFKASTLLKDKPEIEKCLFVVDRKDLDRQTREEFNRFQEGCVEENTNTETLVRRMLSESKADKVIVTTIQKLGLALDPANKQFKDRLLPLRNKRLVFIFDECHRSQFGENHQAIKEFFPKAQLFGFTGTPIFEDNSNYLQRDGEEASYRTTRDIFQKELHAYTITHAIEDRNVLQFHIDYYRGEGDYKAKPGEAIAQQAVVEEILKKHDAATNGRRFNAILATASINDAIAYYNLFKDIQVRRAATEEDYRPLNIACVFSPPAEGNKDVQQLQEDLHQEKADNKVAPEEKKIALKSIIEGYNKQYGSNHSINEFDQYYQDVQQRIKDHKYPNADYAANNKIDIVIVVDMLLTGFDSKYLNTLYVDKNLKYHGLIQAFSRTNRVLNDSKPYGTIIDFRGQQPAVDDAIELFSGEKKDAAREIWLVESAPAVIQHYEAAVKDLNDFMQAEGLECKPEEVSNLRGDIARAGFIEKFKEVQRLKTQLDQYTDLKPEEVEKIDSLLLPDDLRSFRSQYLETAKRLKDIQEREGDKADPKLQQLDFEFVLFASATIDYDYIMRLIARNMDRPAAKQKMTMEQIIHLLSSSANLLDEREDLIAYIRTVDFSSGQTEEQIKKGYEHFKEAKTNAALAAIAEEHGLDIKALKSFVTGILNRMIFDGEQLNELLAPLELGWKARSQKEQELMNALIPELKRQAAGREISGLSAYEN